MSSPALMEQLQVVGVGLPLGSLRPRLLFCCCAQSNVDYLEMWDIFLQLQQALSAFLPIWRDLELKYERIPGNQEHWEVWWRRNYPSAVTTVKNLSFSCSLSFLFSFFSFPASAPFCLISSETLILLFFLLLLCLRQFVSSTQNCWHQWTASLLHLRAQCHLNLCPWKYHPR